MRNSFRLSLFSIVLLFVLNLLNATEARAQIDKILKTMDAHYKALQTLKAGVAMVKYDSVLQNEDTPYEGTVMYVPKPGSNAYVRIDWIKPVNETLSAYDGEYTIFRPRSNSCIKGKVSSVQGSGKANSLLVFMNMSRTQIKTNYDAKYLGQENVGSVPTWHLELTPKTPQSYKSADLWVDGNGMPIQIRIVEKNNDTTTIRLSNLQKNITLKGSAFKVDTKNAKCVS